MTPRRIAIIINPISGRTGSRAGETACRQQLVEETAAALGVTADVHLTNAPGHATALARTAIDDGAAVVVAMGGDGTVNEVARALIGTSVALGIVPCGSGDGLARGLGLPTNRRAALEVALTGDTKRIDVGYANNQPFINVAGVGFDAEVGRLFASRATRGALGYIFMSAKHVWTYVSGHYDVQFDDVRRTGPMFVVGFANSAEYGNGAILAPEADVQDGVLDVLIVKGGSVFGQMWRARRLYWRPGAPAAGMERLRTRTARISGDRLTYHLDGEPFETAGSIEIRVERQALAVKVRRV
jgi:YegS/Rv2252/BmrU family lipid kinase